MILVDTQPTIVVDITMLDATEGGRQRGISIDDATNYMPHLAIDDRSNRVARTDESNVSLEHCMGVLFRPAISISDVATGSGRYPLTPMYYPRVDYSTLVAGATFTVREGGRIVGHGVVISADPV